MSVKPLTSEQIEADIEEWRNRNPIDRPGRVFIEKLDASFVNSEELPESIEKSLISLNRIQSYEELVNERIKSMTKDRDDVKGLLDLINA
jgi:DNA primase large subunit